jgi:phosphatidylinositol glycan class B
MAAIAFLFLLDSVYNGKLVFTPINFLRTNLSSVSLFYGENSWHYYITQGIPILCTTSLPFTLHGIWKTLKHESARDTSLRTAFATILWSTSIYSLGGHKEWRFLHPILPLFHLFAAKSLVDLCSHASRTMKRVVKAQNPSNAREPTMQIFLARIGLPGIPAKYIGFISMTVPASLYVVLFYCDAQIGVLSYFRALPAPELGNSTVGFLMPCHSTPGFAYLHRKELANGGMWALGCEPPLQ